MVDLNSKVYPQINEFGGINTGAAPFNIADNESTEERNLGSDNYPSISQRKEGEEFPGMEDFEEIVYIGHLFNGELFCIGKKKGEDESEDIDSFQKGKRNIYKYSKGIWEDFIERNEARAGDSLWMNFIEELSGDAWEWGNTNMKRGGNYFVNPMPMTNATIFGFGAANGSRRFYDISIKEDPSGLPIYYVYTYFSDKEPEGADNGLMPLSVSYLKEKDGRLISAGPGNSELHISEYQKARYKFPDDFAVYDITTEDGDNTTGIALLNDTVLYFKRSATYILYGKTPDSYYLDVLSRSKGCLSYRSIAEAGGALFWLSDDGIYAYSATTRPYKVSQRVQKYIDNMEEGERACATSDGRKYYISLKQKSGEYIMLMFDTEKNIWHVWDSLNYTQLLYKDGELLGIADNKIYKLFTKPFTGEWHYISKPFDIGGISRNSNIYRMFLNVYGKKGAEIEVSISGEAEGDDFKVILRKKYGSDKREKLDIKIAPCTEARNLKHFRLKISGRGECEVYGVDVYMRVLGRSY